MRAAPADRRALQARVGFASRTGRRPDNQDFAAATLGADVVAAVADGVGGRHGGREAAETAVRGFLEGFAAAPATLAAPRAAARALEAMNGWIHAQGAVDPRLAGMACAFAAVILRRRVAHVVHAGDCRVYRFNEAGLELLTQDHVLGRGDFAHALTRAVGLEASLRLDHRAAALGVHDRFLLTSDGVHGALSEERLEALLKTRAEPQTTAESLVAAALAAGGADNATAVVVDVVDLPSALAQDLDAALADLPILPPPRPGAVVDGFAIGEVISEGRYSRVYRGRDAAGGPALALKFPQSRIEAAAACRLAFVREAYVAVRVRSAFVGEVIDLPPGRRSRLYTVMPFYEGETLERRVGRLGLAEGVAVAVKLARALDALHRIGVAHRDVKPDNVILTPDGGLKLIDLGVARAQGLADFAEADTPGTPSYMAPELFAGDAGDEASDLYALGVTVYRLFAAAYPYGEVEPFMTPRFEAYAPLARRRPDLPAWLDAALAKAVAAKPGDRYGDAIEFAHDLETALARAPAAPKARAPLYERNPVRVWQAAAGALALVLLALLAHDFGVWRR